MSDHDDAEESDFAFYRRVLEADFDRGTDDATLDRWASTLANLQAAAYPRKKRLGQCRRCSRRAGYDGLCDAHGEP